MDGEMVGVQVFDHEELPPAPEPEARPQPRLFTRLIATPPGAPWDQAAAAHLEAVNGAPLAVEMLHLQLRRLGPWSPRMPGRYVVGYVRRSEVDRETILTETVEGTSVQFTFAPAAQADQRARRVALIAAAAGLALGASGLAAWVATDRRAEAEASLVAFETRAQQLETQARRAARMRADAVLLDRAGARGTTAADLLDDLAWVSRAKDNTAGIRSVRWGRETFEIETSGGKSPVLTSDRTVRRVDDRVWVVERAR